MDQELRAADLEDAAGVKAVSGARHAATIYGSGAPFHGGAHDRTFTSSADDGSKVRSPRSTGGPMHLRRSLLALAVTLASAVLPIDHSVAGNSLTCGNGVVEGTEECDAGNPTVSGTAIKSVLVASGLAHPTYVTAPPLDPNRLFIVEQPGRVRLVKNGAL